MILSRSSSGAVPPGNHVSSAAAHGVSEPRTAPDASGDRDQAWRTTPINQSLHVAIERPAWGIVAVVLKGEIDLSSMPRLTELVRQRLTAASLRAIVLDLSEVSFVSSSGIELLLHTQRRAEQREIGLFLVSGSHAVRRLLELTGLGGRFVHCGSVAEAVEQAQR